MNPRRRDLEHRLQSSNERAVSSQATHEMFMNVFNSLRGHLNVSRPRDLSGPRNHTL
jgi:hypothetical protein